ncbi:MAG: glycosyltransferase family 4 protein [Clostridia bacterium]|nr:glycosyltransferase family 4 protein [Clostridia bacterium]
MKILVVCQYYYPEPFRITDICEELVGLGHDVTVVTGTPNYPMGDIYPGYEHNAHRDESINGVTVHRCPIHPRKTGPIHRLWNYYSFSFASTRYIKRLDASFDVVFINQLSPVMMAKAGMAYARKHHKRSVLYCLDLWPASLGVGGIRKGLVYKWFRRVSHKIYRSVDKILISSQSFSKYFEEEFGIHDTTYLPQYAETNFSPNDCAKQPNDTMDLMFAGNVGTAQSVQTIIRAAAMCKDIRRLRWHIVGDGRELNSCRQLAKELEAPVTFYGRKPLRDMPTYYAMADAMLVTMQKDPVISLTLPGKVQSYLAAGKPIIGAASGETQRVIGESESGVCADAEDAQGLADCVREFVRSDKQAFMTNARRYYNDHYTKEKFMEKLEEILSGKQATSKEAAVNI